MKMFIRWQNYRSVARWNWRDPPIKRCKAVLVESVRVNGKPRLKHIAFIASYESPENRRAWNDRWGSGSQQVEDANAEMMRNPECRVIPDRIRFWRTARERLDRLANRITPEDRTKIEAALALQVPPTTPEEIAASDREMEEGWQRLKELAALRR
jgi:hypothetical protein